MITLNYSKEQEELIRLAAKHSPQQTVDAWINKLIKDEIKRVVEIDEQVRSKLNNCK